MVFGRMVYTNDIVLVWSVGAGDRTCQECSKHRQQRPSTGTCILKPYVSLKTLPVAGFTTLGPWHRGPVWDYRERERERERDRDRERKRGRDRETNTQQKATH